MFDIKGGFRIINILRVKFKLFTLKTGPANAVVNMFSIATKSGSYNNTDSNLGSVHIIICLDGLLHYLIRTSIYFIYTYVQMQ